MEISELTLWALRLGVLVLMYLFLLVLVLALLADARAAGRAPQPAKTPERTPTPAAAPVPARPMANTAVRPRQLAVVTGTLPTTGREYPLVAPLQIGRGSDCDITIPSPFVSTHHARVFPQGEQWVLEDQGSKNGTLLNGQPLILATPLNIGDRITLGDTEIEVR